LPRLIIVILCFIYPGIAYADSPTVVGLKINLARAEIVKLGWKPRETHLRIGDDELEREHGNTAIFFKSGFREVEICTGTGVNPCIFNYVRGKSCLRVYTTGEQPAEAVVTATSSDCPPPESR